MSSAPKVIEVIGRTNLREKLGVSDTAISNAISRKKFPPKWYRILKEECDAVGVECPLDLFSFAKAVVEPRVKIGEIISTPSVVYPANGVT